MSLYLYLDLAIIIFPLILTFEKRIRYYSKIKYLVLSILIVSSIYIMWDVFATLRGHWSFNPLYVFETKLFGLPIEEILFFITVPFSCIFAFEGLKYFIKDRQIYLKKKWLPILVGIIFLLVIFLFWGKEYTTLALSSVGITLIFASFFMLDILFSKLFWIYSAFTIIVFVIFNYILTSIPVVEYSPSAIIGIRFITIPIEDFMFNFSMLTLYLVFYLWFNKKLAPKSN